MTRSGNRCAGSAASAGTPRCAPSSPGAGAGATCPTGRQKRTSRRCTCGRARWPVTRRRRTTRPRTSSTTPPTRLRRSAAACCRWERPGPVTTPGWRSVPTSSRSPARPSTVISRSSGHPTSNSRTPPTSRGPTSSSGSVRSTARAVRATSATATSDSVRGVHRRCGSSWTRSRTGSGPATGFGSLVAGGSFPRFARNLGTGEPTSTGTGLVPSTHVVAHVGSRLVLPVAG